MNRRSLEDIYAWVLILGFLGIIGYGVWYLYDLTGG